MNNIIPQIESYIYRLRTILNNLENYKPTNPREEIGEKLVTEGISAFVGELLESKKAGSFGRKWATSQLKQDRQARKKQFLAEQERVFYGILEQVRSLLRTVSIQKERMLEGGNSSLLLKKLATVENYAKLDTKVRKAINALAQIREEPLVYNSEIPKLLEEKKQRRHDEGYLVLKRLERTYRQFLQKKLASVSDNWWKERVSEDVRKNAEERKRKNESPWSWVSSGDHPIEYIDFADYAKIITRRDNWREVFQKVFHDRDLLVAKMKELEPIRNAIGHSRDLNSKQIQRLNLYAEDFIGKMR